MRLEEVAPCCSPFLKWGLHSGTYFQRQRVWQEGDSEYLWETAGQAPSAGGTVGTDGLHPWQGMPRGAFQCRLLLESQSGDEEALKHQKTPDGGTFCKTPAQSSQHCQDHHKQGTSEKLPETNTGEGTVATKVWCSCILGLMKDTGQGAVKSRESGVFGTSIMLVLLS